MEVGLDVNKGVLDRRAHAGPRGEVDNPSDRPFALEYHGHEVCVRAVALVHRHLVGPPRREAHQVLPLDAHVIVVVHLRRKW